MKSRCIFVGTLQILQFQPTYLRKSLGVFLRNASSFVPKRVLIVAKLTRYHFEKLREPYLNEEQFRNKLLERGTDYDLLLDTYRATKDIENEVTKVLKKLKIEYKKVDRSTISRTDVAWADLVFPIGGDGTFLLAANLIFDNKTPILGINSYPSESKGFLMLPSYYTNHVSKIFELLKAGQYDILMRSRIRTTLKGNEIWDPPFHMHEERNFLGVERFFSNGQLKPAKSVPLNERKLPWLALNEAFVAEVLAAKMSTLLVKVDDEEKYYRIKSSGICISTGTGSTSWYKAINSVNPQLVRRIFRLLNDRTNFTDTEIDQICSKFNDSLHFKPEAQNICYAIRDMNVTNVFQVPKNLEQDNFCKKLTVRSLCFNGGLVLDGGIAVQFNLGTTAEFKIDPEGALRSHRCLFPRNCRRMEEDDRQNIRSAVENILSGSINSQRSSYTQQSLTRTSDIVLSEDLIAGARQDGRMSNVRRFFCLFVTFDLLLTVLMWLICSMIAGENLETAFINQVVHYHIKTSLFDIVLTTTTTCAFLLAKVFLFDWLACKQPVFQVLLILTSFILSWAEAWFFDFRVIPQETHVINWIQNMSNTERAPLIQADTADPRQYSSIEPSRTFYTPMDSPAHSDTEDEFARRQDAIRKISRTNEIFIPKPLPKLTTDKIDEYKMTAETLLKNCYELLVSKEWKLETTTSKGDVVSYMQIHKPEGKIMKITGIVDAPANMLINWLFDGVEAAPSWNKLVTESMKLQQIDENTDIIYQATSPQGGGLIGARDFIILRYRNKYGNYYISSGMSVTLKSFPNRKNVTRGENGVSCWAAEELTDGDPSKCRFTWILNTNLKGWLPQKVVDRSLSTALVDFMSYLRKYLDEYQRHANT
ncbi:stAR-related lipid transfer protein 3 isoform X2 [Vespula squamosa]|uniref:StAR-related lipid transfer protein 3 isoform X2 n=1 Tax=Vespula squamosa TaxID=30214 RepID=A0ABD2AAN3_VESSQ